MKQVNAKHVNKMLRAETSVLYGPTSQQVRLEWITSVGGTYNAPHNVYVGATETLNVSDNVAAIFGSFKSDQRERINLNGQTLDIDQLGFWYFDNSLNLSEKTKLLVLHRNKDKYHTGAGSSSGSVWTPDDAPGFTADEWISYWLVFSDRRFKITDNDETTVTVDLNSGVPDNLQALPASGTAEILGLVEWYPVRRDLGFLGGAISPIGLETIFQSVFCSRIPIVGR